MRRMLSNLWQRVKLLGHYRVLFIPLATDDLCDPVKLIFDSLTGFGKSRRRREYVLVKTKPNHLTDIVPEIEERGVSECMVVFGHPYRVFTGFAVNAKVGKQQDVLDLSWWEGPGSRFRSYRFKKTVAHVCYGRKILANWPSTFSTWVSYKGDIHAFLFKKEDRRLWTAIAKLIIDAAIESRTIKDLKDRILFIYELKMSEIADSNNPHWVLHAIHLQQASNELTTNEEL